MKSAPFGAVFFLPPNSIFSCILSIFCIVFDKREFFNSIISIEDMKK